MSTAWRKNKHWQTYIVFVSGARGPDARHSNATKYVWKGRRQIITYANTCSTQSSCVNTDLTCSHIASQHMQSRILAPRASQHVKNGLAHMCWHVFHQCTVSSTLDSDADSCIDSTRVQHVKISVLHVCVSDTQSAMLLLEAALPDDESDSFSYEVCHFDLYVFINLIPPHLRRRCANRPGTPVGGR